MQRSLNIDIVGTTHRFEALIEKILPKIIYYKLLLRGKGLEFDGYRNLAPDDDASSIDWKASVRANTLLTKQYVEERDIKIIFAIDVGSNMVFGSGEKMKCEYCAELACAFAKVMIHEPKDQLGYIFFNEDIVEANLPKPGKEQYEIFAYEISDPYLYGGGSNIKKILDSIIERLDPSITLLVIISDFIKVDYSCFKKFETLGGAVETIAIILKDPLDMTLPDINKEIIIEDSETGGRILVNPKIAKKKYEENAKKQEIIVKKIFRETNIDYIKIMTNKDFCPRLAFFLKKRSEWRE